MRTRQSDPKPGRSVADVTGAITLWCALMTAVLSGPVPAALIGHWDFEEGSGSTAFNASAASGLDGAIVNALYSFDAAIGDYALDFNGINSFVEVANSAHFSTSDVSIALWFKGRASTGASANIIDKGHGGASTPYYAGYALQYHANTETIDAFCGDAAADN